MNAKIMLMIFLGFALVGFAQEYKSVEAPAASDNSITNGSIEAPDTSDKSVDVNAVDPMETPAIEAAGQADETSNIPDKEVETGTAVDADPATDAEMGDDPDLP